MPDVSVNPPVSDIKERSRRIAGGFSFPAHLLAAMSKDPARCFESGGYHKPTEEWNDRHALHVLESDFPNLHQLIANKSVLDYGCGDGFQSIALARAGAAEVLGVDIVEQRLAHARHMARDVDNVGFSTKATGLFDVVISLNAFEHFTRPEESLEEMAAALRSDGRILISFGPPWLSPYGAHMHFFTPVPWVHLLFPESVIFEVRKLYRDDNLHSYSQDLNKMTIRRFENLVKTRGLRAESLRYFTSLGLPVVGRIPWLRELFIAKVVATLHH